jgi:hypothetical protein
MHDPAKYFTKNNCSTVTHSQRKSHTSMGTPQLPLRAPQLSDTQDPLKILSESKRANKCKRKAVSPHSMKLHTLVTLLQGNIRLLNSASNFTVYGLKPKQGILPLLHN